MALGLFAQIGLVAHLFSLLVPALGEQFAGLAAAVATASAIAGRTIAVWLMPRGDNRRGIACASYAVQIAGSVGVPARWRRTTFRSCCLASFCLARALAMQTLCRRSLRNRNLPKRTLSRVVPLIIAISQATYAFAPAAFGLIREFAPHTGAESAGAAPAVFVAAAVLQGLAIVSLLIGGAAWPRSSGG